MGTRGQSVRSTQHVAAPLGRTPVLWFRRAQEPPTVWSPLDAFLYNLMTTNVAVFFGVPFIAGAASTIR